MLERRMSRSPNQRPNGATWRNDDAGSAVRQDCCSAKMPKKDSQTLHVAFLSQPNSSETDALTVKMTSCLCFSQSYELFFGSAGPRSSATMNHVSGVQSRSGPLRTKKPRC